MVMCGAGCSGVEADSGTREPLRVRNAQFIAGELPTGSGPAVLTIDSQNNLLVQGQAGKRLGGDAGAGATSVALRLTEVGRGYWVRPVGSPDPQTPGALAWEAVCDFARDLRPGKYQLEFSAGDADGNFGPANSIPLLVQSLVPAVANVVSLEWDSDADLDLRVVGPDGKSLSLDRDAGAACNRDGLRLEDAAFEPVHAGIYQVWVDMNAACGAPVADFVVTVRAGGRKAAEAKGRLLDIDADGGATGLFVMEFSP